MMLTMMIKDQRSKIKDLDPTINKNLRQESKPKSICERICQKRTMSVVRGSTAASRGVGATKQLSILGFPTHFFLQQRIQIFSKLFNKYFCRTNLIWCQSKCNFRPKLNFFFSLKNGQGYSTDHFCLPVRKIWEVMPEVALLTEWHPVGLAVEKHLTTNLFKQTNKSVQ